MDQIVAQAIGDQTPFASLELISRPEGSFSKSLLRNNISWRNGTTPVPRETEPRAVYDRLTGTSTSGHAAGDTRRQSVLDTVLADARSLRTRVGSADQDKLDEYLDAVRSVEKQMSRMADQSRAHAREKASTFPRPPEGIMRASRSFHWFAWSLLLITAAVLYASSYKAWGDPIIDLGRDLYLPETLPERFVGVS